MKKYTGFFIGSALVGITGLIQVTHTTGWVKSVALAFGVSGATSALVTMGLGVAHDTERQAQIREIEEKLKDNERLHKKDLELQATNIKSLNDTIQKHQTRETELNSKLDEKLAVIADRESKIGELQAITSKRDTRIADFLEETREHTKTFLQIRRQQLETLKKSLEKAIWDELVPTSTKQANRQRIADIIDFLEDLSEAITQVESLKIADFKSIIDYAFEMDDKLINIRNKWKSSQIKGHRDESEQLRNQLDNSMPKEVALERFNAGLAEYDERLSTKYDKLLNQTEVYDQLINNLEERNLKINELFQANDVLEQEITELKKPLLAIGTSDYALAANRIANYYYEAYKYKLDVIHWVEHETGYSILFATRRNPGLTESELLPKNTQEQLAAFTNCLVGTLPKFTFNYQHSTVTLDITLRKPAKKDSSKADIDSIWIPVTKFESYVRSWERVRITAGSTGGKSPTAKNLALAIMNSRQGQGTIKLFDPQDGSKKDYWNMPKAGTSHADNLAGMKEVCKLIDERRHGSDHPFILYIFDEVDNTVTQLKEGTKFKDLIKVSLKEGSHANVGVIYIGQSADANEVPGMTHSNWGNAVQLHIGSNAGAVIETMKTLTAEDSERLLKQYRKIQEYCDRKNEELGLDTYTDATAYRFALAVPLTGLPKFIQLPSFDSYEYNEVMSSATEQPQTLTDEAEALIDATSVPSVCCPHCESSAIKRNGRDKATKTIQQYKCTNCGKGFSQLDLSPNSN
ncbi:MAG: hypothetical protein PUP93_21255 [Rhizonema sp. NSF051]|nr:hypothetical protein [Rhizonema sp. NSF051]